MKINNSKTMVSYSGPYLHALRPFCYNIVNTSILIRVTLVQYLNKGDNSVLNAPIITTVTAAITTMTTDQRLLNAEESLKEKHISIINEMSQTELKQFK